ncbi:MAG: AEC family transporter [Caldimonas sp.]
MQAILAVTIPFFGLVLLGWIAARLHWLPGSAIPGLNAYVLFFALPCMLFGFGSSLPIDRLADPVLIAIYLAAALSVVALTVALTLGRPGRDGVSLRDAGFGALVAAFPNSGFMGVPLLVALLGETAAGPVIGAIVVDLVFTSTICLALAQSQSHRGSGGDRNLLRAAALSLRGALTNPLPGAIALGAVFAVTGSALPSSLAQIVRMLGESATPVALFTVGTVLWRAGQHADTRTPVARYLPVALVKLVAHPALVFGLGTLARTLGAPLTPFGLMVLTLTAALPSASNVSLLAERYGADNGRIARIIMASTVLAFATFSALAWVFGIGDAV